MIEIIAGRAEEHLENTRFRKSFLKTEEKVLLLPAACVDRYLTRLHRVNKDVFHPDLQRKDPWLPLFLFVQKFRRNY